LSLLEVTGYQYTTAVFGKSLVSEDTPGFSRVGLPLNASCVIGLGAWTTSKDIGTRSINGDQDKAIVSQGSAFVGGELFANVPLEAFMKEFHRRLNTEFQGEIREANPKRLLADELWAKPIFPELVRVRAESSDVLDYDKFFKTLNERWVKDSSDTIVVVDSSFPLIASQQGLHIKSRDGFVAQAAWLSIGYAAPAAIGIKCAVEDKFLGKKRMIVIAGNGAFQETCQAVSSYGYLKQNTVVFVLANGIYGIEQKLVNPNPFREPPAEHSSKEVYEYNNLSQWNYEKLVSVFGAGDGHVVETVEQLESVISLIQKDADKSFIVHVKIPRTSIPAVLKASLEEAGEDEWQHPNWPPKEIF
jgi:indolepyruvate decarboxylase